MIDGHEAEMRAFVDWCYGKEMDATHGAVAKFVQAHVRIRPEIGSGQPARWSDFTAFRTHTRTAGPDATPAQVDAAIAAFRAA